MNDVNSHTTNQQSREHARGTFTEFLVNKGLSENQVKKVLYGVAIVAFLLSLLLWL